MSFSLTEITDLVQGQLIGDETQRVTSIVTLDKADKNSITVILEPKFKKEALCSKAGCFITYTPIDGLSNQIVVKNTRLAMAIVIDAFVPNQDIKSWIHPSAVVSRSAVLGEGVRLDAGAVIGDDVIIGEGTSIGANVVVGKSCVIGNQCTLYPNVTLYDTIKIGNRVILHSGGSFGVDGFGYVKLDSKKWKKITHIGSLVIEDDVEVGANVCIDRGCLGDTVIRRGTKIDNLVQIAHNCQIGEDSVFASQVGITGSSHISNNVTIGGQAGVNANVGEGVTIAAKSGVTKEVGSHQLVSGFPAWEHKKELKKEAYIRKISQEG